MLEDRGLLGPVRFTRELQGRACVARWFPVWACRRWELVCGDAEPLRV